jgi:hypothetical protein
LPKFTEVGDTLAAGALVVLAPVPVSDTTCGLPLALSLTVSKPVRVPVAVGLNLMLIVQLPLTARELPQVPRPPQVKSPEMLSVPKLTVELPVLVKVTNCAELIVPTA